MNPVAFLPLPWPRDASALFWATLLAMLVAATAFERRGWPRSTALAMALGYLIGLFSGGDRGGLAGAVVGVGLASLHARVTRRKL